MDSSFRVRYKSGLEPRPVRWVSLLIRNTLKHERVANRLSNLYFIQNCKDELPMRTLKVICLVFCLLSLASALTGIRAVHWSTSGGLNITKQRGVDVFLWSVLNALLYASAAYGIHRRVPVVWKYGWAVLIVSCLEFMIRGIDSARTLPGGWAACIGIVVGGIFVTVYWGAWWNRQRDYFQVLAPKE